MKKSLMLLALGMAWLISPASYAQADAGGVGNFSLDATRALKNVETNARMDIEQPKKLIEDGKAPEEPSITVEDGGVNRGDPAKAPVQK